RHVRVELGRRNADRIRRASRPQLVRSRLILRHADGHRRRGPESVGDADHHGYQLAAASSAARRALHCDPLAEPSRIDDLRRRIQKDPASIAFAQLGEELRRAGELKEAVAVCRAGLSRHPGYVSARVTLGRALMELNDLDNADAELRLVLKTAPDNLSAVRARADIFHRRGDLEAALAHYRVALG